MASPWHNVYLVIPIKNTFVHFGVSDDRKRSHSAPPGLCRAAHVTRPPKKLSKRRPFRKKWVKKNDDDADALKEYARVARQEKWKQLAARALDEDRARDRALAKIAVVGDIEIFLPKLRESMEEQVFQDMVRAVFHDERDVETLKRMGVLRGKGGRIEFWCADALLMHPTMSALLYEARRYRRMSRSRITRVWI